MSPGWAALEKQPCADAPHRTSSTHKASPCPYCHHHQEHSALEHAWRSNKYLLNWRSATLNGLPLNKEGLMKIRDFTVPDAGTLKLDYVTYKVGWALDGWLRAGLRLDDGWGGTSSSCKMRAVIGPEGVSNCAFFNSW